MKIFRKQKRTTNNGRILILFIVISITFSIIPFSLAEDQLYTNISVDTAYNMINDDETYPDLIILDVRTPEEYNQNHLFNAINRELAELESRLEELADYKNHEIIVYCNSGYRSQQASEILSSNGFTKIFNMLGGIQSWIAADYDLWVASEEGSDILNIPFDLPTLLLVSAGLLILAVIITRKKVKLNK